MSSRPDDALAIEYLRVYGHLEEFSDKLPDIPANKKLKKVVQELSWIFRYKWEEERAKASMNYWREQRRKTTLMLRDKTLGKKKKRKKRVKKSDA